MRYLEGRISRQRQNTSFFFFLTFVSSWRASEVPPGVRRDKFKSDWWGLCLTHRREVLEERGSRSWPPSLATLSLHIFQLQLCLLHLFFVCLDALSQVSWDRVVPLLLTWDTGGWERPAGGAGCCCCAGWFPHVPHSWSGAGSLISHPAGTCVKPLIN